MPTRYLLLLVLCLTIGTADAQITLTADDFPFQLGTSSYLSLETSNEDGANTAAIEALIAQSGGGQTYDFTGIDFEFELSGMVTVESGATGPGAGTDPLSQATQTAILPFSIEGDETTVEGTVYTYLQLTDDEAFDLGGYFEGESDGTPVSFTLTREPNGDRIAAFPYTFGTSWTSDFTESSFGTTTVSKTYEVEGWGTLIAPGVAGVPVLRVKVTEERTTAGVTLTSVCYEFRAAQPVVAIACEGDDTFMEPPTASVNTYGAATTDAEAPAEAGASATFSAVYPNPIRGAASLEFEVLQRSDVRLVVYDVLGREVAVLADGVRAAGEHREAFDAASLAPGVYLARLTVDGQHWTRRLTVAD
jgi:hypothetical protein